MTPDPPRYSVPKARISGPSAQIRLSLLDFRLLKTLATSLELTNFLMDSVFIPLARCLSRSEFARL